LQTFCLSLSFATLATCGVTFTIALDAKTLHAQVYLGSIQGQVTDPSGAKIPNATVTVEDVGTHFKTKATTNAAGNYTLAGLTPGTYVVTSTARGFKTATRQDVVLASGQLSQVDFSLTLGATSETVQVTADNSLLDTGDANISTTLSHQEVTDLPNVGRNPFVLATLAAGVINGGSGGYFQGHASQYTNPFSGVAVQIASNGSSGHNRLTIDGIPDDPAERFSGASYTGFVPSPEAVQEVRVSQSIFDAQIGHGNGTVTDTIVRSGTNKLHGAAYYVFQNTYLNANLYQNVPNQYAATNPTKRNNDQLSQTGIVLAGPVVIRKVYDGRDKTFFMVAFERYASHTAQNYSAQVPTAAELGGDFSGLCNTFNANGFCTSGVQLYVPNSPVDANGNRTQYFPNNNIASAISPVGAAYLTFLPKPNVAGSTNYIATQTSYPSTYPSFITRVDHAVTQKNKLNAIYFQAGLTQNFPLEGFPKGIGPSGYGYHVYRNTRGGSLDDVQQFSSSLVLDSRLGVIFHPFGLAYPGNSGYNLGTLGISSTGLPYDSFPGISLSDPNNSYASLASGASGQVSEDTVGSLDEILTKSIRTHTLRFGFEGNLTRYNVQNPQSGFGSFGFDRRFTQQNSVTAPVGSEANSGDALASLELGAFSTATYNITPAYALQQKYTAFFFQDDWRTTSKLTLNLGVRWDYESPFTERYNKQVTNFCTTCASPLQATVPGLALNGGLQYATSSNRTAYPADFHAWQPRVGAAYQLTPTTVFRAGFGIIYFNTLETPIGTGFSQTTSYTNTSSSAPLNSIANPFPNGVVLPTGSAAGLATGIGTGITFVDPHHVQPRSAQYTANVQQQLPGGVSLQIAYVGSRPTRLEVNHNIDLLPQQYYNQGVAGVTYLTTQVNNPLAGQVPANATLNAAKIQRYYLLLPYPQFSSVTEDYSSIGSAPYNALQIQVSHPMSHHISFQGNFTWDKLMQHTAYLDNFAAAGGQLESVQDGSPNMFGNIWGTLELPKFLKAPAYERLTLGGWQLNLVSRLSNGSLIGAPGNVNIIGNYRTNQNFYHQFNTCYESVNTTTGALTPVNTVISSKTGLVTLQGCDANNSTPAFAQRLSYTSQNNSTVLDIRQRLYPLLDTSLFKRFILREGVSFELRGEFFNVLNTAEFGGPNTSLGAANTGSAASNPSAAYPQGQLSEANDARIGQLTVRLNF
jgi:hypothetical protein